MKVAVVHNHPEPGKPDSEDVLREVEFVTGVLAKLDSDYRIFSWGLDNGSLKRLVHDLGGFVPESVFNLVESLGEDQRLYPAVASLFEIAGYSYTGSRFEALLTTTDKVLTKALLSANSIPSPAWQQYLGEKIEIRVPGPWMIKPAWEDASVGIGDGSIIKDLRLLRAGIESMYRDHNQPVLIEQYIDGREFNIALLENADGGPEALPLAEMVFRNWPDGKPKIINYSAKWDENSFEYHNTVRRFNPPDALLDPIRSAAMECWKAFGLSGYARVDMRLDDKGNVFVIEVNTNPCIAPDAGFIAATREAGYSDCAVIERILAAARRKRARSG